MIAPQPDEPLRPDLDAALHFLLKGIRPSPVHLAAINPNKRGAPKCKVFRTNGPDGTKKTPEEHRADIRAWIEEWNGRKHWNVYFTLGDLHRTVGNEKPSESDVRAVRWFAVDLDPRKIPSDWTGTGPEWVEEERARILPSLTTDLPEGVPGPPTWVLDSGGGYWGLWALQSAYEIQDRAHDIAHAKSHGERLIEQYRTHFGDAKGIVDSVANLERLCRLPGTVNYPDKKKREEKGRCAALASVVEEHCSDRRYPLYALQPPEGFGKSKSKKLATVEVEVEVDVGNVRRFESVDDIKELQDESDGRNAKCRVAIVQGRDPDDPQKTRSEPLLFVCCQMLRAGCADDAIYSVITDPAYKISASVLDKGARVEEYALRQIRKAREAVADEEDDFAVDKDGKPYRTPRNVRIAVKKLGVMLEFDEFADRTRISGLDGFGPHLDDAAVNRMWLAIEEAFGLYVPKDRFWSIVQDAAMRNRRHPVREFLGRLAWDGRPRLDRWLTDYLDVEDSDFSRAIGTIVLVAAVRRVRDPGCKFDEMLVLEGPQGGMKSTALAELAVRREWFSDDLPLNAKAQQFIEATVGKWIVEAAELNGMRKSDAELLKSCLSRQVDGARMAYGRLRLERPRQFVIFGTTNSDKYLKDRTGNRRYWPVKVGQVNISALQRDRDQLWAEAVVREGKGESIRLDESLYTAAGIEQEKRRVEEPWVEVLSAMLDGVEGRLRSADAWMIVDVPSGQRTQAHNERLGDAMRELGWKRAKLRFGGNPEGAYWKGKKGIRLELRYREQGGMFIEEVGVCTNPGAEEVFGGADPWEYPEFGRGWRPGYAAFWEGRKS